MARERDDDDYDDDRPRRERPSRDIPNYLVQSILVTICCCLPLGIVAIINSAKVNGLVAAGKYREAEEASAAAKKWSTIGAVVGVILGILNVVVQMTMKK